jgi:chromosome segregation ATPase
MKRRNAVTLILFVIFVLLTADTIRLKIRNSKTPTQPEETGFWSKLIQEGRIRSAQERKEEQMASVSVIVALLAFASTACALYWCRRMHRNLSRFGADILNSEQKRHLLEGVAEIQPLRRQLDQLQHNLNEKLQQLKLSGSELDGKVIKVEQGLAQLQLSGEQLDGRIAEIEKACSSLGAMSEDLDTLKDFRENVDQLHSRLRQALNGNSAKAQPLPSKPRIGLPRRA